MLLKRCVSICPRPLLFKLIWETTDSARIKREACENPRASVKTNTRVRQVSFLPLSFLLGVALFLSRLPRRSCAIPLLRYVAMSSRRGAFTAISFRESPRSEGKRKKEDSLCRNVELRSAAVELRICARAPVRPLSKKEATWPGKRETTVWSSNVEFDVSRSRRRIPSRAVNGDAIFYPPSGVANYFADSPES